MSGFFKSASKINNIEAWLLKDGFEISNRLAVKIAVTGAVIGLVLALMNERDAFVVFLSVVMGALLPFMLMIPIALLALPFFLFRQKRREGEKVSSSMMKAIKPLFFLVLIIFLFYFVSNNTPKQGDSSSTSVTTTQAHQEINNNQSVQSIKPIYLRPITAPNGQAWPSAAGYVKGFKKLYTNGLSKVTIDNSQNNSDVFVKLVAINGRESYPVRVFFIPAFSQFTISNIRSGLYDIRYRDLESGNLSKSESFTLQEIENYGGVEYSNVTMTLYKIRSGNMQTYGLSENEF